MDKMDEVYFASSVVGSRERVVAERSFAYEFYHQTRKQLDTVKDFPYRLAGEINKIGHPIIHHCIPDFVLHRFGSMEWSLCVIEVKHISGATKGFQKDIRNLRKFRTNTYSEGKIWYQKALLLVFGEDETGKATIASKIQTDLGELAAKEIRIIWRARPGSKSVALTTN